MNGITKERKKEDRAKQTTIGSKRLLLFLKNPDQSFHSFRATKSVDRRFWATLVGQSPDMQALKLFKKSLVWICGDKYLQWEFIRRFGLRTILFSIFCTDLKLRGVTRPDISHNFGAS